MSTDKIEISDSVYKGHSSIVMENDTLRLELVPLIGAKLVSLVYKPTGKEWLVDSGNRPLVAPAFASAFGEWDMSGWDECFPTIDSCRFESGVELPDHGELWSLPWSCKKTGVSIACAVEGVLLPYRFSRQVSLSAQDTIKLSYEVKNESKEPLSFLWAAHPQFVITEPTEMILPSDMQKLQCVYGGKQLIAGESYLASEHRYLHPEVTGNGKKFYYPDHATEGWSTLREQISGNYLKISWAVEKAPYLGIWIDEGMFNDRSVCALEPGIGYYDSLNTAVQNGTARTLEPYETYSWDLDIELGS
ncbi:hypothetical protein [Paenibacillus sinopodophylli]|uniref:hypothetical protein n=1 Tax=Paenibacillus sinopodophylli TaxID=1837342 RepID=UPI00110CCD02|nr:hypothetical protein [Paenibacillus sinopodophylli]